MLYVFHVDQGRMLKFDMNLALSNVRSLKETISRVHGLAVGNQVLLVSGGEALYSNSLVCSYSAGTDTNPIYMFSTDESKNTPQPWPSIEFDQDIKEQVDRSLTLPATYATVVTRAQIAQKYFDLAREQEALCENMIHEQHLQHQGWSAVIANLEDLTDDFKQRVDIFFEYVNDHQSKNASYFEMLTQFRDDLQNLSKIPILPGLMPNADQEFIGLEDVNEELYNLQRATQLVYENITSKELVMNMELGEIQEHVLELEPESENKENSSESEETSLEANKNKCLTLLEWISSTENHKQLRYLAQACVEGLHFFNKEKMTTLSNKITVLLKQAGQEDIKAIKGIEDRLSTLEQIIFKLKNSVQEQKELATAFQQNQNRASNLGDPSILPDLCASHRSQLLVMVNNQHIIRENMRRVFKAKEELGKNLSKRLQFIVRIENSMSEYDNNLLFYHRSLRRLERHLNIVEQIHQTPLIYMHAVTEVVRRRIFSNHFRSWSQELACDTHSIYNEEIMRRQDFSALFEGHFLNTLFPGMEDMPPPYATEVPTQFDSLLPTLTESDIDVLSTHLPHIEIKLPDLGDVIQFFTSRSANKNHEKRSLSEGKMQSTLAEITPHRPIELHAHLKDEFESETDTEEFEKVGQSPNDQQNNTATVATSTSDTEKPDTISISTSTEIVTTHNIETLTEENLGTTRLEVERMRSIVSKMSQISTQSLNIIKTNLDLIRSQSKSDRHDLESDVNEISTALKKLNDECKGRECELTQRLTVEHELELSDARKSLGSKDSEIKKLITEREGLHASHIQLVQNFEKETDVLKQEISHLTTKMEKLEVSVNSAEALKEKALTECREKLIQSHKTEIESLRCRFKLMASMERSPSDTSLEKIERPDVIDIACHESIIHQTREDLIAEQEQAVKMAIEMERKKWINKGHLGSPADGTGDIYKKIFEEKEKQLDTMREREEMLTNENQSLRLKVQSLAQDNDYNDVVWLKNMVDSLSKEKTRLEQELKKETETSNRTDMTSSSASTLKGSSYINPDPPGVPVPAAVPRDTGNPASIEAGGVRPKMSSSQMGSKQNITTESCSKNDQVFIVWNDKHWQYVVVQDSSTHYFLHGESYSGLNLKIPSGTETDKLPHPLYTVGRVLEKEYCHARKDENRYKVPKGTKFYRVKVLPVPRPLESNRPKRERNESTSSSNSMPVSRSTSTQHLIDSFSQTESPPVILDRSMVDSGVAEQQRSDYKERTLSVTEEDEPISLLEERCRYISISEEEEKAISEAAGNQDSNSLQIPTESSSEKDQDDSDEYRSLEAKDDLEFPSGVI